MTLTLPSIYPISDRRLSGVSHAEQVRTLATAGARFIQLREKHLPSDEFFEEAKSAAEAARELGVSLIINDRVDIARMVGAAGVHLGQDDLPPAAAREILGRAAIIGFSTHTVEQAKEALEMPIDYVAFGPIFPTATKEAPDPVTGLKLLRTVSELSGNVPVVAIGGIDETNLCGVLTAGAVSAAVISGLYRGSEIAATYSELVSLAKHC